MNKDSSSPQECKQLTLCFPPGELIEHCIPTKEAWLYIRRDMQRGKTRYERKTSCGVLTALRAGKAGKENLWDICFKRCA